MSARDGPRVAIGHNYPHAVGAYNCPTIVSCVSFRCSFDESDEPTSLPQWAVMSVFIEALIIVFPPLSLRQSGRRIVPAYRDNPDGRQ